MAVTVSGLLTFDQFFAYRPRFRFGLSNSSFSTHFQVHEFNSVISIGALLTD